MCKPRPVLQLCPGVPGSPSGWQRSYSTSAGCHKNHPSSCPWRQCPPATHPWQAKDSFQLCMQCYGLIGTPPPYHKCHHNLANGDLLARLACFSCSSGERRPWRQSLAYASANWDSNDTCCGATQQRLVVYQLLLCTVKCRERRRQA